MGSEGIASRDAHELDDALVEVLLERMTAEGLSVNRLAGLIGMQQPTLAKRLKGRGHLSVEDWERVALALGEPGLEPLVEAARRRL